MIDCLIFSRNRACQLDLLIRSIQDNFKEIDTIGVIIKASNEFYAEGYRKLLTRQTSDKIIWVQEEGLKEDIKMMLAKFKNKYMIVLVDDEVVIRDYSIKPAIEFLDKHNLDMHTLSLRMHIGVNYTYTANVASPAPLFERENDIYYWNWSVGNNPASEYFYPSCLNSHVYSVSFFSYWAVRLQYQNLNDWEGNFNTQRVLFKPYMSCFEKAKTINIAANISQTGQNRHSNNQEYSLESLNTKYLQDYQISTSNLYNIEMNTPTFEYDYQFEKVSCL